MAGTAAERISEGHDCDREGTQVHRGQIARTHTLPKVPRTSGRAGEVGHARRKRGVCTNPTPVPAPAAGGEQGRAPKAQSL